MARLIWPTTLIISLAGITWVIGFGLEFASVLKLCTQERYENGVLDVA